PSRWPSVVSGSSVRPSMPYMICKGPEGTDPDQARDFVSATGVDALAVAVGSSHAMTIRTARLDHGLIARLAKAVPVPLVLHGSTGVPDAELRQAVASGMVKINIGTALNAAFTGAVRDALAAAPAAVDPHPALTAARRAMTDAVASALRTLSGGGYGLRRADRGP
ncbi:class II fructose-bisphosphate aldolase, partial [Streptomyces coeruleorubidus]